MSFVKKETRKFRCTPSYVFNNIIYERMIGFKEVASLKGKSLCHVLVQELGKLQIPLCNMVGKGFDGASNMPGKEKGMQQQLTDAGATLSLYFHCFAHCLNLVFEKCAETCGRCFFDDSGNLQGHGRVTTTRRRL